jgi:hypothetical protein
MRIRGLSIVLASLLLGACQDLAQMQDDPALPHATIAGSHTTADQDRYDTFRVLEIGGHPVVLGLDPSKTLGVDAVNGIAVGRNVQVTFEGLARYRNSARSLFWSSMHVDGKVDFVPASNAQYVVRGEIAPSGSTVWIEDAATHQVIDHKFVGLPSAPASAPEYKFHD